LNFRSNDLAGLSLTREVVAGIDIGGTKCSVVLGYEENNGIKIIGRRSFLTHSYKSWKDALNRISYYIEELLNENDGCRLIGAGISCGGPLNIGKGLILSPPNLPGWDKVPIVKYFQKRLSIKTTLQNDANACALAEWRYGAGRGCRNMIFLTFGTGIGAGLILNGRLYSGTNGMAGEIGHIRMEKSGPAGYGKKGSLEGFCSGGGIARLAKIMVPKKLKSGANVAFYQTPEMIESLNAKTIAEAAVKGDPTAKEIFTISGHYLGMGLALLIDILNPERIVIGSIFARSYGLLWPEAKKAMMAEALDISRDACEVLPAALGDEIGDYASISVALYED
jgi:glucokinase